MKIMTGAIEGSNVNAVGEMTSLIDLQRQFEMQVKLMSNAEDMDKASDSLLRMKLTVNEGRNYASSIMGK